MFDKTKILEIFEILDRNMKIRYEKNCFDHYYNRIVQLNKCHFPEQNIFYIDTQQKLCSQEFPDLGPPCPWQAYKIVATKTPFWMNSHLK
jgi:hypothetical protein